MQKITPHLWFDKEAHEAVDLYTSTFSGSKIITVTQIQGTPSGSVDIISFQLAGQSFMCINAGPYFRFTPAVSFMAACGSRDEADAVWNRLAPGGKVLMELASYPFSERYGWTEDRFGLSWQVIYQKENTATQKITPSLLFAGKMCGRAEEAMKFYTSVFRNSAMGPIARYEKGEAPGRDGMVKYGPFKIEKQAFAAMDSGVDHDIAFNEALSFLVSCRSQEEIDYYWERLSAVPEAEQCGWLKDKYGVSWQITPAVMDEMMSRGTADQKARVTGAFLKMKKFDIAKLEAAFRGD